jgi:hypothetical protein
MPNWQTPFHAVVKLCFIRYGDAWTATPLGWTYNLGGLSTSKGKHSSVILSRLIE